MFIVIWIVFSPVFALGWRFLFLRAQLLFFSFDPIFKAFFKQISKL